VARTIKGDISRYNEVKAFAQFGTSDLDQSTRNLLNRGEKLMELLKQGQYRPQSLAELTVSLFIIDHVLDLPTADVSRFEEELLTHLRDHQPALMAAIGKTRDLSDESKAQLDAAIAEFKGRFRPSEE
jgi:F-type H+-transporting ATPase subunit alpha